MAEGGMSGLSQSGQDIPQDEAAFPVTMTPSAAERFLKALSYAESIVHLRAEELADSEGTSRRVQTATEHGEWLRWGYGRVFGAKADAAIPTIRHHLPQQPQRQDSLSEQLDTVLVVARWLGCYDAEDWIKRRAAKP